MGFYGILISLTVIQLVVALFGGYAGYTIGGIPHGGFQMPGGWYFGAVEIPSGWSVGMLESWGLGDWIVDTINFAFNMSTFNVDGVPEWMSMIWVIMNLLWIVMVVRFIRGLE